MNDIVERLRSNTEEMAHRAVVDMTLWDRHSNACLEAADEIERLRRERDEALDPKLESLRLENGVLDLSVTGPIVERMATAFGAWMQQSKTTNYAEMRIHDRHETGEVYIVTVQRAKGKTPHELRVEAERERDEARARALEEAAGAADHFAEQNAKVRPSTDYVEGREDAGRAIAAAIRALAKKDAAR